METLLWEPRGGTTLRVRGIVRHRQLRVRAGAALLFASAAFPTIAFAAESAEQAPGPDILVIGTRYISGIQPERDLDEEAISSYSASTVDGLSPRCSRNSAKIMSRL